MPNKPSKASKRKVIARKEKKKKTLADFGFVQLFFDFYTAAVE